MPVVSLNVDEETKTRMDGLKHLNWNELLSAYVLDVIKKEEDRLAVERGSLSEEELAKIEGDRSKRFLFLQLSRGIVRTGAP
jgi:hypothetical protein